MSILPRRTYFAHLVKVFPAPDEVTVKTSTPSCLISSAVPSVTSSERPYQVSLPSGKRTTVLPSLAALIIFTTARVSGQNIFLEMVRMNSRTLLSFPAMKCSLRTKVGRRGKIPIGTSM